MKPEYINLLAIALSIASVATGYIAVGKRGLWDFPSGVKPYLCGSSRAYVYALVIATTMWAMYHAIMLVDWYIVNETTKEPIGFPRQYGWMIWHCGIEIILIAFHIWARFHRIARQVSGKPDLPLWGPDANIS